MENTSTFLISEALLSFVKKMEGFRSDAYLDTHANPPVWTIGYGETENVKPGDKITEADATMHLIRRLGYFSRMVQSMVKVPMTQGQHDALTDFAYNMGTERLRNSTLLRLFNAGFTGSQIFDTQTCEYRYTGAAAEFDRWVFAGGKKLPGLVLRRACEQQWFLGEVA